MPKKFKRLVHQTMARTGVSHQGAVNILRKGAFLPLSAVQTAEGMAAIVSAVLPDGNVVLTPAKPVRTPDGVWLEPEEGAFLYRPQEVRPYRLAKDERWARFVEDLFELVTERSVSQQDGTVLAGRDQTTAFIFNKDPDEAALILDEGDSVSSVSRPRRIVVSLQPFGADLTVDGNVVGQDAVKIRRSLRERMLAVIEASQFGGHGIVDSPEWYLDPTGNGQLLSRPPDSLKPYACGRGPIGLHPQSDTLHGLLVWARKVGFTRNADEPLTEPHIKPPIERVLHGTVLKQLAAVQAQAVHRPLIYSADEPKESQLGFLVSQYGKPEVLHLAPVKKAHELPPGRLLTMMMTSGGRKQIAVLLEMGINVLSDRDIEDHFSNDQAGLVS